MAADLSRILAAAERIADAWERGEARPAPVVGRGLTRIAFAVDDGKSRYVVKIPLEEEYRWANLDEAEAWNRAGSAFSRRLVPVLTSDSEGRWLVMPRVEKARLAEAEKVCAWFAERCGDETEALDCMPENVGLWQGRACLLDYPHLNGALLHCDDGEDRVERLPASPGAPASVDPISRVLASLGRPAAADVSARVRRAWDAVVTAIRYPAPGVPPAFRTLAGDPDGGAYERTGQVITATWAWKGHTDYRGKYHPSVVTIATRDTAGGPASVRAVKDLELRIVRSPTEASVVGTFVPKGGSKARSETFRQVAVVDHELTPTSWRPNERPPATISEEDVAQAGSLGDALRRVATHFGSYSVTVLDFGHVRANPDTRGFTAYATRPERGGDQDHPTSWDARKAPAHADGRLVPFEGDSVSRWLPGKHRAHVLHGTVFRASSGPAMVRTTEPGLFPHVVLLDRFWCRQQEFTAMDAQAFGTEAPPRHRGRYGALTTDESKHLLDANGEWFPNEGDAVVRRDASGTPRRGTVVTATEYGHRLILRVRLEDTRGLSTEEAARLEAVEGWRVARGDSESQPWAWQEGGAHGDPAAGDVDVAHVRQGNVVWTVARRAGGHVLLADVDDAGEARIWTALGWTRERATVRSGDRTTTTQAVPVFYPTIAAAKSVAPTLPSPEKTDPRADAALERAAFAAARATGATGADRTAASGARLSLGVTVERMAATVDDRGIAVERTDGGETRHRSFTATASGDYAGELWAYEEPFDAALTRHCRYGLEDLVTWLERRGAPRPRTLLRVTTITVEPRFRRKGVARALYEAALRQARVEHAAVLADGCWETGQTAPEAKAVWRALAREWAIFEERVGWGAHWDDDPRVERMSVPRVGTYPPCDHAPPLWTLLPEDLLSRRAYDASFRARYLDEKGERRGSNMDLPAENLGICVGQWRIDDEYPLNYGSDVAEFRYFDSADLAPTEDPLDLGRGRYVEQYQTWIREGRAAPPVTVLQGDDGSLRVSDGNRRHLAHKREGRPVPGWFYPAAWSGLYDARGRPMTTGLTWEIAVQDAIHADDPVPDRVRAEYERRLPRYESLRRRQAALADAAWYFAPNGSAVVERMAATPAVGGYEGARLTDDHVHDPALRALADAAETTGELLGNGNFGVAYRVAGERGPVVVKLPTERDMHGRNRTRESQVAMFLHEAGIANELAGRFTVVPVTAYVETSDGRPALVREYGEPLGGTTTIAEIADLEHQLYAVEAEGTWDVADELLVLRRPGGSLFVADVGWWRKRAKPRGSSWMDGGDVPDLLYRWARREIGEAVAGALSAGRTFYGTGPKTALAYVAEDLAAYALPADWESLVVTLETQLPHVREAVRLRDEVGLPVPPEARDLVARATPIHEEALRLEAASKGNAWAESGWPAPAAGRRRSLLRPKKAGS